MKKIILLTVLVTLHQLLTGQSMLEKNGSPDFILSNSNPLNTGTNSRMFFKNGTYYTAGISTVGSNSNTARLVFSTNSSGDMNNLVERMTILNNGFVGIGTANPLYQFHLKSNTIGFTVESQTGEAKIGFYTSGTAAYLQTHNAVPLFFATNNAAAQMTLSTTGRLGIGTTTPVSKLDVKGKATMTQQAGEDAALEINGAIRVSGTNPAAFVIHGTYAYYIKIDHPTCNNNPDAIILVTPVKYLNTPFYDGSYNLEYNNDGYWYLKTQGHKLLNTYDEINIKKCDNTCITKYIRDNESVSFNPQQRFNVLVITN